jgi:hypothetical protein
MDFTEQAYKALITTVAKRFQFIRFCADLPIDEENIALWRHDIDFSPQRALALANIEASLGVVATYYVQLSSRYYSVFEPETCAVLRQINQLGHDIGLHFDTEVLAHQNGADYESRLKFEANVLEQVLETEISSFTLHNPTTIVGVALDSLTHAGLANGSASAIRKHFEYCSDSNGIWRFRTLREVVEDKSVVRLYALTHPEWWQFEKTAPRTSLQRCIDGRAKFCGLYYDELLKNNNRPNIKN